MKWRLCLPLLMLVVLGCNSKTQLVPAGGTVTLGGKPLANAKVITQPTSTEDNTTPGSGSFAVTDAEGNFSLELQSEPRPGAIPGEHVVRITEIKEQRPSSDDTASRDDHRTILPASANDGSLRFTIPPTGTDQMNFDLEKRRRR